MAILLLYGAAHFLVDALSAAAFFCAASTDEMTTDTIAGLLLLYHVLAFGLAAIFGLAVDAANCPRRAAVMGCLITASSLLLVSWPIMAVVVAGVGNALFHVGGAVKSLQATPQRATGPGLFVAPGSLGLLLGTILGRSGQAASLFLLPAALGLVAVLLGTDRAASADAGPKTADGPLPARCAPHKPFRRFELILALILVSIAIRSLLGFLGSLSWQTAPQWVIAATLATTLGKAAGGNLADRWGWTMTVATTAASLPLLTLGAAHPAVLIAGLLLLNLAMPVTLTGVAEAIPGHGGFAFGLTSLALLAGALPALLGYPPEGMVLVGAMVLVSSLALDRALQMLSLDRTLEESK